MEKDNEKLIKFIEKDNEDKKYHMNEKELDKAMHLVDEFKTRHSTINQSINETYNIGNKLLSYLEKQVIIDYLIQGKIKDLETRYPDLVKKAMRLVGFEMYYEIKVMETDEPLDTHHPWYIILMEK